MFRWRRDAGQGAGPRQEDGEHGDIARATSPQATSAAEPGMLADTALVLTGGGARAAYQVGLLVWLAKRFPDLRFPILTGVSAGAVNATYLAGHRGTFGEAALELAELWKGLSPEQVFRVDIGWLARNLARWGARLVAGGLTRGPRVRGLVDTTPLRETLVRALGAPDGHITGIDYNLRRGALKALAISATRYATGQSVVWVQGRDVETWARPMRRSVATTMTVDHVMASAALPLFFPAVRVGTEYYGDGGIRQTAPLSPALHLGARRIIAISTRHGGADVAAHRPLVMGYPPPAQVMGVLLNAVFLDLIDQDVLRLQRLNSLLAKLPEEKRDGLRIIDLLMLRPSEDLGRLAREFEPRLPGAFRTLTRGLGTREASSPDALSMLMFQSDYLERLIEIGERDAEARRYELEAFIARVREEG